jgi:hypothetical protein
MGHIAHTQKIGHSPLGLAIALAFLAVGLFMGLARQSIVGALVSVAAAFAVILGPGILAGIVTGSAAPVEMAVQLEGAAPEALPLQIASVEVN